MLQCYRKNIKMQMKYMKRGTDNGFKTEDVSEEAVRASSLAGLVVGE